MIPLVTGRLEWPSAQARLEGYREALRRAKLPEPSALVASGKDWGLESGEHTAARLLEGGKRFGAVFAHSDLLALGAIAHLRGRGLRVPEDVSIIGYDDIPRRSLCRSAADDRTPADARSRCAAVQLIVERDARDRGPAHRHLLRGPLVVRESVAPPAVAVPRA